MSSRDDLQVWASTIGIDPVTSTPQREPILADIWQYGWLRETPVTAQDINQLMYTVTDVVKNDTLSKTANLNDVDDKAAARTNLGLDIDTLYNTFFDRMHPVGTVYTVTGVSTNPATLLGRGTWAAIAQGRVLIGVGTGTDVNSATKTITDGQTSGEYVHTQTQSEIASHTHPYRDRYNVEAIGSVSTAVFKESTPVGYNGGLGTSGTDSDNNTWLYYDSTTTSTGSSTPFNVSQPSLGVYYWKRTA